MQLLSDTRAFGEAFLETHVQLLDQAMQGELVKHESKACQKRGQCRAEPPRLPRCSLNLEAGNPLRAIPFAIAIAGKKAKMVGTRAQIGVNSFASSAGFTPLTVEALQKISE